MSSPDVRFAVISHSNIGFLMADPSGVRLLRDAVDLSLGHHNFSVAGNCRRFASAWSRMYGGAVEWLPNLYDVATFRQVGQRVPWHRGQPLRVGIFGATRPLKNLVTAAAAAVELAGALRTDVEVLTSSGREEGGASVAQAIEQVVTGLPHVKLTRAGWQSWPQFRARVAQCHVLLQPSYTESFNMVTADGVAEGVASVVSDAIDWAPREWVARADDVDDVARVAWHLLQDIHAVDAGQSALRRYVADGLHAWKDWLGIHGRTLTH